VRFPHCDQRILHAPGECKYCDMNPEWQELREAWGIAFTGHLPEIGSGVLLCPADYTRNAEDYNAWGGNRASS
jgi:hypothetical protein